MREAPRRSRRKREQRAASSDARNTFAMWSTMSFGWDLSRRATLAKGISLTSENQERLLSYYLNRRKKCCLSVILTPQDSQADNS